MTVNFNSSTLAFALFATACSGGNGGYIDSASDNDNQVTSELDSLFMSKFKKDAPGAAVIVSRNDSIVFNRCYGLSDLDKKTLVSDTTMFNICSVSKQFSAVALLKLAEEGKLSLYDSVSKYFPEFRSEIFNKITLANLLSHTSGIPDARPRTEEEWNEYIKRHHTKFKNVKDYKLYCEEEESLRYLESLDNLVFEPGTAYEYQNPTYQLPMLIVERITGMKFDDWMRNNIFIPAGMPTTVYFEPNKYIPNMAHGYERDKDGAWHESDYGEANFFGTKADGGIYTTPLQFVEWDKAIYHDKVMTSNSRKAAHTPYIKTDIPFTSYGYGWFIEERVDRPKKIYHTGDNGGFLIFEGRFPEKDIFYLIFATHPHWEREATVEKVDSILQAHGWI